MLKKLILIIAISAAGAYLAGCNSLNSDEIERSASTAVNISSFSLASDNKVLDSLQNVFFSIDLVEGRIFNADSLPYGTNVSRLVANIKAPTTASMVQIEFPRPGEADSIINYLTNSTDSIDFSNGPVKLRVASQSTTVEKLYEIRVNVHQVKPDTLAWSSIATAQLPTSLGSIKAQCTTVMGDTYYCLTTDGTKHCLASTTTPYDPQWQVQEITLPFAPDVESLRSNGSEAFMLATDGALYTSTDLTSWTATGTNWQVIYGAYGTEMMGAQRGSDGTWTICSYPSGLTMAMPKGFPVSGASQEASYSSSMAFAPIMVITGGRDADGNLIGGTWGYDGTDWAYLTKQEIPFPLEGMTMVPYGMFRVPSSTWKPVEVPILLALGGRRANGAINGEVFISSDWGITWRLAPELMQLPDDVLRLYGSTAFVHTVTMHLPQARSLDGGWTPVPVRPIPPHCVAEWPMPASRASEAITEWECPAVYVFGGRDADGQVVDKIWRGIILRYTFPPKY